MFFCHKNNNFGLSVFLRLIFYIFTVIFLQMERKTDILFSEYIIDGTAMDSTPGDMLKECMPEECWKEFLAQWHTAGNEGCSEPVIDETADRIPVNFRYDCGKIYEYLSRIIRAMPHTAHDAPETIDLDHPFSSTRLSIAETILGTIWKEGHFRISNLNISAEWIWDTSRLGNMAAFYTSVEAATGYIYELGTKLAGLEIRYAEGRCEAGFRITGVKDWLPFHDSGSGCRNTDGIILPDDGDPDISDTESRLAESGSIIAPAEKTYLWNSRKCPDRIVRPSGTDRNGAESSRLIYIPFDTCQHKLGGSCLAEVLGNGNENGPEIMDPDYFIDCFEVVRELVEDGIVQSGVTVGKGGLLTAVAGILGYTDTEDRSTDSLSGIEDNDRDGTEEIEIDISGIEQAYIETDSVRILFAEIPGVLIQIADTDYDYVDSQLLLQDIAYYPVARPGQLSGRPRIRLSSSSRTGLFSILAALMDGQSSEGED